MVIKTKQQRIVLELLAIAMEKEFNEHFERMLKYAEKLFANDI
jgi:hypothetical protein